ncbi:hypothetical protein MTO96_002444 [Rhipicephalus appendiculatus]
MADALLPGNRALRAPYKEVSESETDDGAEVRKGVRFLPRGRNRSRPDAPCLDREGDVPALLRMEGDGGAGLLLSWLPATLTGPHGQSTCQSLVPSTMFNVGLTLRLPNSLGSLIKGEVDTADRSAICLQNRIEIGTLLPFR